MSYRQFDEYSQSSGQYPEDDSYEQELREYGHSQRERRERSTSPHGYEDAYYETGSQTGRDFDLYEKHRYEHYRSPSSEREMELEEDYKYKNRTSDERYYYKDKYYEIETKSRERSLSSDSEQRYRVASEIVRTNSRSRSPPLKHKRTKELPISYRSQSPPTPTDDEPLYYSNSRDPSPTDFDSAFRKYGDYKKRLSSGLESDKSGKSSVLTLATGLRKEIESVKAEDRLSRKRSYEQASPKKVERQQSRGSRSGGSLYDYDRSEKLTPKELLTKVARLKSEVYERTTGKSSPSSGSSYGDIDPSTLTEAELAKLHREKQKLLDKLTQMDDNGSTSDTESNGDMRHIVSKKARLEQAHGKYFQKSESLNLSKRELKEKLKLLDSTQSCRKQMERMKKEQEKELLRELKKTKSAGDVKRDPFDYSDTEENLGLNSPKEIPSGFMPKKRRKLEGESDRKSRSYRVRRDEEDGAYSSEEDKSDLLQRQISSHSDLFDRTRTLSGGMDIRLENESIYSSSNVHSHGKDESRRISSGSESNKEHTEHPKRRNGKKKNNHITPLIPLGEDDLPDPEVSDPRVPREKRDSPLILPLPKFAQYIHFSPLPSPVHTSPKTYSDLSKTERTPPRQSESQSLPETAHLPMPPLATENDDQSPCFSPQSSSSKTHSPSQSPSGSASDNSKGNSEENVESIPSNEIVPDPVLEDNKPDSLDSLTDLGKDTETKEDETLSDSNSDPENLSCDNISIEERIRQLDEKWSKAQAQAAVTPKTISEVESVVNISTPSNNLPLISAVTTMTSSSPSLTSIYSKFKIKKKNDPASDGGEKGEPSEIVRTVLSKSSIFDQDSKRLEQIYDKYDDNESNSVADGSSPKVLNVRTKAAAKEMPLSTLPGSLMERLGQNTSFPTLTVNTTLADQMTGASPNNLMNKSFDSPMELHIPENITPKTSPRINFMNSSANLTPPTNHLTSLEGSITPKSNHSFNELELQPPVLETSQNSTSCVQSFKVTDSEVTDAENLVKAPELEKESEDSISQKSDLFENDSQTNDSHKVDISNGGLTNVSDIQTSAEIANEKDAVEPENISTADLNKKEEIVENKDLIEPDIENTESQADKCVLDINSGKEVNSTSKPATVKKEHTKKEKKDLDGNNIKDISSRSAFDVDIFGMSTPLVIGKRKVDDVLPEKDAKSILKSDSEFKTESKADSTEVKSDMKQEPDNKVKSEKESEIDKSSQKSKSSSDKEKNKSDKDKVKDKSKSHSSSEPNSKKQKVSKEKKSESSQKDDKHKKKDSGKKSDSHKSSSDKRDKHKAKSDKDKKDSDKKSKEDKDKKEKDEKKKADIEKKDQKDDKKDKHETDKKDKHDSEKKDKSDDHKKSDKSKSASSDRDKKDKKDSHKHDKHSDKHGLKSPDKKLSKSASVESKDKDSSKEIEKSDKSAKSEKKNEHSHKKEHKSSSSHKSKKSKDETSETSKPKESKENLPESKAKPDQSIDNAEDSVVEPMDTSEKKDMSDEKDKDKEKDTSGEKCKDSKSKDKERENKDRDPDPSKSKGKTSSSTGSSSSDKNKTLADSKPQNPKTDKSVNEEKSSDSKKDSKKSKDSTTKPSGGVSNTTSKSSSKDKSKDKVKSDSQKKSSTKTEKSSSKSSSKSTGNTDGSSKKEEKSSKDNNKDSSKDKENKETKDKETPKKKTEHKDHRLTELEKLDVNLASFCLEPYVSMYDKVKRRSTDKKDKEKETEELRKHINEYKKKKKKKKFSLSDVTESSEISTDEDTRKRRENKKKFGLSFVDSDSSSDEEFIQNPKKTSKTLSKKPKRILDVYSSDSEEEETVKSPAKKGSTNSKNKKVDGLNFSHYESLSDSDHKNSGTKPAKSKTTVKTKKSGKSAKPKSVNKKGNKPKIPGKNLSLKDLFSDDSDDSHFSDSDSDSDIMIKPKLKKKPDPKLQQNKKVLPKGSSIYTSSEESESEPERKPNLSPVKKSPPKKQADKRDESDTFTSDPEFFDKDKSKKQSKSKPQNNQKHSDSFESDHFFSEPEFVKPLNKMKEPTAFDDVHVDTKGTKILSAPELDVKTDQSKEKVKKQKGKDKSNKENKKSKKKKAVDIISDSENLSKTMSKLEVTEVFSETVFEKDEPSEIMKKMEQMPVLSNAKEELLIQQESSNIETDINKLGLGDNHKVPKAEKGKSKKHKKEKKRKNKDKDREKNGSSSNLPDNMSDGDDILHILQDVKAEAENSDMNSSGNSARNLFDDLRADISPEEKEVKKKHKKSKEKKEHVDLNVAVKQEQDADTDINQVKNDEAFESARKPESEKKELVKQEKKKKETKEESEISSQHKVKENIEPVFTPEIDKQGQGNDVFEFTEEEENEKKLSSLKESHVKIMKPSAFPELKLNRDEEKDVDTTDIPIEIEGIEIEYQTQEQDYKDESEDVCPEVETSEVVIETNIEEKSTPGKAKQKPKKRRGRRNSIKESHAEIDNVDSNMYGISCDKEDSLKTDLTTEAVSSLETARTIVEETQSEVVPFDPPTSNEQELVIDESATLQVQDETASAVESIVEESRNDVDETAKAVESILWGNEIPGFGISDPTQPTPQQLEEAYLGNLNQPEPIPLQTVEVEATTTQLDKTNEGKAKGKRRGRRSKSGQSEISHESEMLILETIENVSHGNDLTAEKLDTENKPNHLADQNSYHTDVFNQHSQNDDDDDADRLHIVLDPPKPEPKKKQRKPKQTKAGKIAEMAALAAESKLDNIFGDHHSMNLHDPSDTDTENKEVSDMNRDSISENELDNSKNEDLLFIDREDQRHDSDLLSPDERSNEDMAASAVVRKQKRGRKPKNYKEMTTGPKSNSPRGARTVSPRSPRSNDPRSPKYEASSPLVKPNDSNRRRGKGLLEDGDMKEFLNEETGEIKLSSIENIKNKLIFSEGGKNAQKFTNVFDFDENDETTTIKQQRQRRRKGEVLQSPENRGIFSSPERNQIALSEDKVIIGSLESKMPFNSPEHKIGLGSPDKKVIDVEKKLEIDMKSPLFSPKSHVENQKMDVRNVVEEKDPEPLFKAFFEAKSKSGKENDKIPPVVISRRPSGSQSDLKDLKIDTHNLESKYDQDKSKGLMSPPDKMKSLMSPPISAQMSNVEKTIENVSKGLFEGSTDDESGTSTGEGTGQRKRTSKKSRDEKKEQMPVNSLPNLPPGLHPQMPPTTVPGNKQKQLQLR